MKRTDWIYTNNKPHAMLWHEAAATRAKWPFWHREKDFTAIPLDEFTTAPAGWCVIGSFADKYEALVAVHDILNYASQNAVREKLEKMARACALGGSPVNQKKRSKTARCGS